MSDTDRVLREAAEKVVKGMLGITTDEHKAGVIKPSREMTGFQIVKIVEKHIRPLLEKHDVEIADIRQRLKGLPESKLSGEHGLAAATMRQADWADELAQQLSTAREDSERLDKLDRLHFTRKPLVLIKSDNEMPEYEDEIFDMRSHKSDTWWMTLYDNAGWDAKTIREAIDKLPDASSEDEPEKPLSWWERLIRWGSGAFLRPWHWKREADFIRCVIHETKIKVLREAIVEIDKWDPDGYSQQAAVKAVSRMVVKLRDGIEITGKDDDT